MLKKLLSLSLFVFIISGSFYGLPSIFSPNKAFADTKVLPVVELFTAEWCGPCVTANHNVDDLLNELGRESFTLFKHHSPGNGGMNNPYGSKRNQKFKIKGIPAVVINGVVSGYDVNQLAWNKDDLKRRILENHQKHAVH
jgi:thiol-disulfide isomerase/thioredoxin